jgi:23S rRNA pseudouridine1911/1915/1917 synthase
MDTRSVTVVRPNRLDKALASLLPEVSRSSAQRLIEQGRVLVNGLARDASHRVQPGDILRIALPEQESGVPTPQAISLKVLYEDDDVIAIDKPPGMVVHPAVGNMDGTVVNALLAYAPGIAEVGDANRPGIVHRLDKETSGVLLVARNPAAFRALQAQFKSRSIEKTYLALCVGRVQPMRGLIDRPIARDPGNRKRMAVVAGGREAVTRYAVTEVFERRETAKTTTYSLVRARPLTGRTHQLRVHFASVGTPIVGDALYGMRKDPLTRNLAPRHMLHSSEVVFRSPSSGASVKLHAPLPADMRRVIDDLSG